MTMNAESEVQIIDSFWTVKGRSRQKEELFSLYFVDVNVIENLKRQMNIPLEPIPKDWCCLLVA